MKKQNYLTLLFSIIIIFGCSHDDTEVESQDKITLQEAKDLYSSLPKKYLERNLNTTSTRESNGNDWIIDIDWEDVREDIIVDTDGSSLDVTARIENSPLLSKIVFFQSEEDEQIAFMVHWLWEVPFNQGTLFTGKIFVSDLEGDLKKLYFVNDGVIEQAYIKQSENENYRTGEQPFDTDEGCDWEMGCVNLDPLIVTGTNGGGDNSNGDVIDWTWGNGNDPDNEYPDDQYDSTGGGTGGYPPAPDESDGCPEGYEMVNGECVILVVDSPEDPIENIEDMLSCIDVDIEATITIYADQPDSNNPNVDVLYLHGDVGHAFISIQQGSHIFSFGFYPMSGWGYFGSTEGTLGLDANHPYDVSISNIVSGDQLQSIIQQSIYYDSRRYKLSNSNCTNFAIQISILAGFPIDVNECFGTYGPLGDSSLTPAAFGEHLRNISLPDGATRNTDGGSSPENIECSE